MNVERDSVVFQKKNRTIVYLRFKTSSVDSKSKACLAHKNPGIRHNKRILHFELIDLVALLQKSLDRAIFLYNFTHGFHLSGVRALIAIVNTKKFYKML